MRSIGYFITHPRSVLESIKFKIADLCGFDKTFLKIAFKRIMGYELDLKNPKTFQEKIQWLKLYDRKPEYTKMVDKHAVKEYVADKIGSKYIIPTLGVWDKFDDIDFSILPEKFVLKTTHDSGGVVICKNKETFDKESAKIKLTDSLNTDFYKRFKEWPYKNVPRRIIAEEFIECDSKMDLTDYKIYCFNGQPKYIQVIQDRSSVETIDFFDTEWNHQEFYGLTLNVKNAINPIPKPNKLDEMIECARCLAKGLSFVRLDMYYVNDEIKFGEITFYPSTGWGMFTPNEWSLKLGNMIKLPKIK